MDVIVNRDFDYFLKLWNVTLESPPLETNTSLVAQVSRDIHSYILKISLEEGDERTGAALRHYDGCGAVRLIQEEGRATLLERAFPGTHLSHLLRRGEDDKATFILCEVIHKLHEKQTVTGYYPSVEDLQESFESYLLSGDLQISETLVREAQSLYQELVNSQKKIILLHGDLHHDNVLYDEKRGWLAIDPKGYMGEPTYEIGAMLRNPLGCSHLYQQPEFLGRRVDIICEKLGFDRERVVGWAFAQAVLAGVWSIEAGSSPGWFVEIALAIKKTLRR
jgi:streptomycin 6-kinase